MSRLREPECVIYIRAVGSIKLGVISALGVLLAAPGRCFEEKGRKVRAKDKVIELFLTLPRCRLLFCHSTVCVYTTSVTIRSFFLPKTIEIP